MLPKGQIKEPSLRRQNLNAADDTSGLGNTLPKQV
jgi:hypothetical protein